MPAAPTNPDLLNAGLEAGNTTGWTITQFGGSGTPSASTERPFTGSYSALWTGASGTGHSGGVEATWTNNAEGTVYEGQSIQAQVRIALKDTGSSQNRGEVRLYWYDASHVEIGYSPGNLIRGNNSSYRVSSVVATPPSGAVYVKLAVWTTANASGGVLFDDATWTYDWDRTVTLVTPADGAEFGLGDNINFTVEIGGTTPPVVAVTYFRDITAIGSNATDPYSFNSTTIPAGTYDITAVVTFQDNTTLTSAANEITVTGTPTPPTTREFKASNSYTYLVGEDFIGLSSAVPSTALITGVQIALAYTIRVLIRSKDIDVDVDGANPNVAFDITDGGTIEAVLLSNDGSSYTVQGSNLTVSIPLDRADFTVVEEGESEGKKWTVMDATLPFTTTIGGENALFGVPNLALSDFLERSLGIRFFPVLGTKPAYADSGDACFRIFINEMRLQVYFDAGSAVYYFASADKTEVISGELVSSCVHTGNLRSADAAGTLQLKPDLTIMDGTQTYIGGSGWTIHAAYPPTDDNQIGVVVATDENPDVGMSYNGLPSYTAVMNNRSRYEFVTANFYADRELDSIYGVHGLPRAFAYNGDFFYKVCTQADELKDSPRHVAYHHGHLALGYDEGRIDMSVIGQPYNFDGALGASSHSVGDKITGLLPLSGTILGVFGSKSIWGISGTTVDNFNTQVISPNIGAIEYTICDMGEPTYANAYGIYTLSQTQRYGDYLGTPMSADVSPWLRPRLVRKYTSEKEVVVAWPVRSKNQYRLAFSDGYVLSMTMNGQAVPTFSKQKYFLTSDEDA